MLKANADLAQATERTKQLKKTAYSNEILNRQKKAFYRETIHGTPSTGEATFLITCIDCWNVSQVSLYPPGRGFKIRSSRRSG